MNVELVIFHVIHVAILQHCYDHYCGCTTSRNNLTTCLVTSFTASTIVLDINSSSMATNENVSVHVVVVFLLSRLPFYLPFALISGHTVAYSGSQWRNNKSFQNDKVEFRGKFRKCDDSKGLRWQIIMSNCLIVPVSVR